MPKPPKNAPTGVETTPHDAAPPALEESLRVAHRIDSDSQHLLLTHLELCDRTDRYNELARPSQFLLHPSERDLALRGNLFDVRETFSGRGQVFVKTSPLPHARPLCAETDLRVSPRKGAGFSFELLEHPDEAQDSWTVLAYEGGVAGRTRALHQWQQSRRPDKPIHRIPLFLSNTWGDRSRDSRIRHEFLTREIQAAARLGVDVLQIDDGWQKGTTANSAQAQEKGGVWQGFWNAEPDFWTPHPERLPQGLEPIVAQARDAGLRLGLWFAPDSWNDFANWRRDAECIVAMHHGLGIGFIKIDGVRAETPLAETNLHRFFRAVHDETDSQVLFDLDVTAQVRPGYFGAIHVGPLFVENRYTDWHNYWPHQTLRNLWSLAWWVDPRRLRMEFLNHARNAELYDNDPLAPSAYRPDALFASVMFANPLGWFEVSNLPEAYFQEAAPLVATWRLHREALFGGDILPLGCAPDGLAWTGFASIARNSDEAYAVLFREMNESPNAKIALPGARAKGPWEVLGGGGNVDAEDGLLSAMIDAPLGFVFARGACERA